MDLFLVSKIWISNYGCEKAKASIDEGVIIIPKSTHVERMEENLDIFDFTLSEKDMAEIAKLDTGKSLFFDHHDAEVTKCLWAGDNLSINLFLIIYNPS